MNLPGVPQNVDVFRSLIIPSLHMPKLNELKMIDSIQSIIRIHTQQF